MRIGTILADTASSGTPSPCGRDDQIAEHRADNCQQRANDQRDDSASERMHAFVDERGRQNVEEHYDDVHDRTTEVCHEQAVEDSGEDTDRNTATRTIGEASHLAGMFEART